VSVVELSVVQYSESLSNRVSNNIKRYIDQMKFVALMAFSFIVFLHVLVVVFFIVYLVVGFVFLCLIL
jgi:hypothetical protein